MERVIDANYINEAAFIKAFNQAVIENNRRGIRTLRINRKSSIDLRYILYKEVYDKIFKEILIDKGYRIVITIDLDDLYQYLQIEVSW